MTSKIVVNNIEADAGVSTVTFGSEISASTFNGNIVGTSATFSGNVNVAGVLTYEDVTSVDAIGLSTFQNGIHVTGGSVGIGTDNPSSILSIAKDSGNTILELKRTNTNTTGAVGTINWTASDGHSVANMYAVGDGDNEGAHLVFRTTSAAGESDPYGSNTFERVRITSNGNVGIGTDNPTRKLDVEIQTASGALGSVLNSHPIAEFINLSAGAARGLEIGAPPDGFLSPVYLKVSGTSSRFAILDASNDENFTILDSGNVGIGTDNPSVKLHLSNNGSTQMMISNMSSGMSDGDTMGTIDFTAGPNHTTNARVAGAVEGTSEAGGDLVFETRADGGSLLERLRIDSAGRLLVGTSTSRDDRNLQLEGSTAAGASASFTRNAASTAGPQINLRKSRGTSNGSFDLVSDDDTLGSVIFFGADGATDQQAAAIQAYVDGTPGANDMPGRLVFSTTADGASSRTERMRINSAGFLRASNTGSYVDSAGAFHELVSDQSALTTCLITNTNGSFSDSVAILRTSRGQSSAFSLLKAVTTSSLDTEFNLRGDGNAYADGSWNGGGADYAEYFEWSDGNTTAEDRRGISVVLDGDKIREAVAGEDPIGVISGNPSVVGDADIDRWKGKYLRDDFGTYIQEDYEVEDEDGNTVTQQRRKLNPDYNPDQEYISREDRPEWDCVGLMGKLRIRKGQVTGARWIKMRDISDSVEEWLVR